MEVRTMSKINEMIKELCPNGVERMKLGEVCTFKRGITITAKNAIDGDIPVIAGGQKPSYYHNQSNRNGETITVAGSGAYAGFVSFWNTPIWVSDAFSVDPCEKLLPKYVFQFLKLNQQRIIETQKGAGVPHVHGKDISNFEIPLPPLPIQREIVNILDKFSSLIDNLDETIQLRQKQYEYYREKLLTFEDVKELKVCEFCDLKAGKVINASELTDIQDDGHQYPCFGGNGIRGYINKSSHIGDYSIIGRQGALCGCVCWASGVFYATEHAVVVNPKEGYNSRYLFYLFTSANLNQYKSQGAQPGLAVSNLNELKYKIPPLNRQQEIVATLDKFEAMISNLKQERELRQKQYEYYREKLLTFE